MPWTIYALRVEGDKNPFYVGCTSRSNYRRKIEHFSRARSLQENANRGRVILEAKECGKEITHEVLEVCDTEDSAFQCERKWIAFFGRKSKGGVLTNNTDGGRGATGQIMTREARTKMAKAKRGNKINVGRKRQDMVERFSKKISVFDSNGLFLQTYPSARATASHLKIAFGNISSVLVGRTKSARSSDRLVFQFRFGDDQTQITPVKYKGRK